jgi:metallo-beta-lactamase family protein
MLEWLPGRYLLIDCGMEQGENDYVMSELPVPAGMIEYVVLTHAHIDHSGNLPLLYQQGFRGKIYATHETVNLCSIMLADSAHIQETDAAYQTKKNQRTGLPEVKPAYTEEDAARHGILGYGGVRLKLDELHKWSNETLGEWVMTSEQVLQGNTQ